MKHEQTLTQCENVINHYDNECMKSIIQILKCPVSGWVLLIASNFLKVFTVINLYSKNKNVQRQILRLST